MKINNLISVLVFVLCLYSFNLYGEENLYQSLGISISNYSGSGLSYRYHFEKRWGIQVTGGAIINDDDVNFATGMELQRDLSNLPDKRLFLIMALGWYGETESIIKKGTLYDTENINVSYYKLAVGFGGELAFGNTIVENLSLGISIFPIGISIKEKHSFLGYDDTSQVSFGASLFTHFNF